jgi:hypothetical protein
MYVIVAKSPGIILKTVQLMLMSLSIPIKAKVSLRNTYGREI